MALASIFGSWRAQGLNTLFACRQPSSLSPNSEQLPLRVYVNGNRHSSLAIVTPRWLSADTTVFRGKIASTDHITDSCCTPLRRDATIAEVGPINQIDCGLGLRDMQGSVLDYSAESGEGIISGDDGVRYTFTAGEWRDADFQPARGVRVDFVGGGGHRPTPYIPLRRPPRRGPARGAWMIFSAASPRLVPAAVGDTVEPARRVLAFLVEIGIGFLVSLAASSIVFIPLEASEFELGYGAVLLWQFIGWIIATASDVRLLLVHVHAAGRRSRPSHHRRAPRG